MLFNQKTVLNGQGYHVTLFTTLVTPKDAHAGRPPDLPEAIATPLYPSGLRVGFIADPIGRRYAGGHGV
jgi:hypothetical protein